MQHKDEVTDYIFSVVMAVYNSQEFLEEAIDSIVFQSFPFSKIQVILVDDGSTDNSGTICDLYAKRYPQNVLSVHQKNGGVASAENFGLSFATGRYINFMDSDDKFEKNVFSEVAKFEYANDSKVDIVAVPLYYFDAFSGPHWTTQSFVNGTRIIDLETEPKNALFQVASSFINRRIKDRIHFDSSLPCAEDAKVVYTLLETNPRYGVVSNVKYLYRKRSVGELSLIATSQFKKSWYFEYFDNFALWLLDYYKQRRGYIPPYLQYMIMADLKWRFNTKNQNYKIVLNDDELVQYKDKLRQTLQQIDDQFIIGLEVAVEVKLYILKCKYADFRIEPTFANDDVFLTVHGNAILSLSILHNLIEFISIRDNHVFIEGTIRIPVGMPKPTGIYAVVGDAEYQSPKIELSETQNILNESVLELYKYCIEIPLEKCNQVNINTVYIMAVIFEKKIRLKKFRYGRFCPVGLEHRSGFYAYGNTVLTAGNQQINIRCNVSAISRTMCSVKFILAFLRHWNSDNSRALMNRVSASFISLFNHGRHIWIISDRLASAGDNGEALFHWLHFNADKNVKPYFVISKKSPDFNRLKQYGRVVDYNSKRYLALFLASDRIISSAGEDSVFNPFGNSFVHYRDMLHEKEFVFLQHGITKDDLSGWLHRSKKNIAGFVTAAHAEHHSIVHGNYGYPSETIWLTGFPRYDFLQSKPPVNRQITIMPTWRQYLFSKLDQKTGKHRPLPGFAASEYVQFYRRLLNDPMLLATAKQYGYRIAVRFHPIVIPETSAFEPNKEIVMDMRPYSEIYADSSLIITDYSSAVFDFSYLYRPIIYCHFDEDEFFGGQHTYTKGYFDYPKDGFGEVEYTYDKLVERILEYMKNGCCLKDEYKQRIDRFFAYHDQNNCERVYKKILALK
jgi:CDP-glycerol glycerophosphotransferase (TagB/SpsB family)/glycosyltransferase involved in cell wall biosynthesis